MAELLVGGGVGQQQAVLVAHAHATDEAAARHGGVDDGDVVRKLRLEGTVKVLGAAVADQAVGRRQLGEDADLVATLELDACAGGGRGAERGPVTAGRAR